VSAPDTSRSVADAATWHDVECGAYVADLALWEQLAQEAGGPVLELGSGTGRVALHLAGSGHDVCAVDTDAVLLEELQHRARERGLDVRAHLADARSLSLQRRFAAILAPMQFAHLLGGAEGRRRMLAAAAQHLVPGGVVAIAILSETPEDSAAQPPPLPDVRERDGWVYSSQPLEVVIDDGQIVVRRLRQLVSPAGGLTDEVDVIRLDSLDTPTLVAEGLAEGFELREEIEIPATADHVGSTVVVMEAGDGAT
jgi:SAM-dependent methyltransferase